MKKIAVALVCCGLLCLSVFAQSGRISRPRIVTTPTPADSNQTDSTQNTNQTKRPPVFTDGNGGTQNSNQTTNNSTETGIEDDEVIRVETNLVTFPVSVLDRNGRFIPGLRQTDFQIFEDGAEQKIEYFAPIEQPFTVVLLIDVSPSTAFKIDEIQNAAITFVNQLRPEDRVIVMSFDQRVRVLCRPTNNRRIISDAIRQTSFGDGTSLYEAVHQAMSRELENVEGRKAIVLFTDGVDTTSRTSNYSSNVREAEEADSLIYTVRYDTSQDMAAQNGGGYPSGRNSGGGGGGLLGAILGGVLNGGNVRIGGNGGGGGGYPRGGGNGSSREEYEKGRQYLEDLSRTSGGRAFEARSLYNLDSAFAGIAEELRQQYSIGYYPETAGETGQRKQIKVRTNRDGAVVRAKSSYIVGATEAKSNNHAQPARTSSRLPF
jgi:VWFA-related protein